MTGTAADVPGSQGSVSAIVVMTSSTSESSPTRAEGLA